MKKIEIKKQGNSCHIILTKDILQKLDADLGDELYVIELPDGIKLSKRKNDPKMIMRMARKIIRENPRVMDELA